MKASDQNKVASIGSEFSSISRDFPSIASGRSSVASEFSSVARRCVVKKASSHKTLGVIFASFHRNYVVVVTRMQYAKHEQLRLACDTIFRSEEQTSELQSRGLISHAVF